MEEKRISSKELFALSINDLIIYLNRLCKIDMPDEVETIKDMQNASKLLGYIGPLYAWLTNMELMANIQKREYKKKDKAVYEEALIRENIFSTYAKQTNILYNTLSRMITIKQQVNQELRMLGNLV